MTAFVMYNTVADPTVDPARADNYGTLLWYKILRGFIPRDGPDEYFPFPPGVTPNAFPLSGDAVTGTGFVDGLNEQYSPRMGERRIVVSSGPFHLAPGDTQEVVFAGTGGLGTDRLSSVAAMRYNMRVAQSLYDRLLAIPAPPEFSARVSYPAANLTEIKISASGQAVNAMAITAVLKQPEGQEVMETDLFDDGAQGDAAAQDGVFANTITLSRRPVGLYVDARVTDNLQVMQTFDRVIDNLTTAGPVNLDLMGFFSDHPNDDGQANPGENIRYGLHVRNQTAFDFSNLRLNPAVEFESGKTILLPSLFSEQDFSFTYNPNDPASFFAFEVPWSFADPVFRIPFAIRSFGLYAPCLARGEILT
ncbi:MAG: choice-of-anchor X domain-containing protein [bacterium]